MFLQKKIHLENSHFERQLSRKSAWNINLRSSKIAGSQGPRRSQGPRALPKSCQRISAKVDSLPLRPTRKKSSHCSLGSSIWECSPKILTYH